MKKIMTIGVSVSMLLGWFIGRYQFMKTPQPPYELTKDAPVYVCYNYLNGEVGSCDKFVSEEMVSGVKYFQVIDGFSGRRELKVVDNLGLFYLIKK